MVEMPFTETLRLGQRLRTEALTATGWKPVPRSTPFRSSTRSGLLVFRCYPAASVATGTGTGTGLGAEFSGGDFGSNAERIIAVSFPVRYGFGR